MTYHPAEKAPSKALLSLAEYIGGPRYDVRK